MSVKRKIIISVAAVLSVTFIVVYFIILPTIRDIKKISDAVYQERVDLEKKYLRGKLLKKTIQDFEKIKPQQEKLAAAFIKEGEELEFITALERVAAANGLSQIIKLQPTQDKTLEKKFYSPLPLTLNATGSFLNTLKYLSDLQNLKYYFNVSAITFSNQSANRNNPEIINTNLAGEIYSLSKTTTKN